MAEDLKITLETKLNQAKEDVKAIQNAGGLSGPSGAKTLNKIQALFDVLGKQDISKLDTDGLKRWLNDFSKLNHYIQSAGRDLSTYSKEYMAQQQKVEQANEKLSKAQDKEAEALKKQEEAFKKYAESKATYYNKATGKQVRDPLKVSSLYEKGQLEIRDSNKEIMKPGAPLDAVKANLDKMVAANNEVKVAQQEVKAAEVTLKTEKITLEGMPSGGSTHPVTTQVDTHTAENYDIVKGAKEQINIQQDQTNKDLSNDIERNVSALNKQSTSLGKAFKQFSIYAIALRTVKKALNEATKTIKDLDKYLTEQAMVTGKTRKQTYALLKDYQQMASDLGATTKEVAEVSTQFMRQGKTTQDALTLTRAAISAAKVAGISTAESVDYLTTAVNGFRLSAQDAMKVSDKFAALAASAAVSYEEVATALSKVAAQANLAGMSIDYTTALLTKGIETTREPAESIGTALKTIIARMREITDYGKTLEDGMDLNNVEAQLRYVDIALRDQNGELRSTEDVLNDLGIKWETLSSNQQAAVAKALAGTRQQSRLIAMMQDYDRVIELQEIAARSAGATSAQAAVYMEGMEAALNKINVAWEKIVSSITDSEAVINFINFVGTGLDILGTIFESTSAIVPIIILVLMKTTEYIGLKLKEQQIARETARINAEIALNDIKAKKQQQEQTVKALKTSCEADKQNIEREKRELLNALLKNKIEAQGILQSKKATAEQKALAQQTIDNYAAEVEAINQKAEADKAAVDSTIELEERKLKLYQDQETMQQSELSMLDSLKTAWSGYAGIFTMVQQKFTSLVQGVKQGIEVFKQAGHHEAGSSAAVIPVVGWIIWAIIEGLAILSAAKSAIEGFMSWIKQYQEKDPAEEVNKLSNAIYKLTEKANAISSITKQYDELDNKIIKTNDDIKEMNELLDKAADKLDEEEKKVYERLATNEQKRRYLENIQRSARSDANIARQQQVQKLKSISLTRRDIILDSNTTNADYLETQSAIYALNNSTLYSYIDNLDKVNDGVEKFTQSVLENLSAQEAWRYASDKTGNGIKKLVDAINNATTTTSSGEKTTFAAIIGSDDYSLRERIDAYDQLYSSIAALGDPALLKSFEEAYQQWKHLKVFSSDTLDYIERLGMSIDEINDFSAVLQKLGYTSEESANKINALFDSMANGGSLTSSILSTFNDVLSQFERGTKDWTNAYNRILNGFQAATGVTLTNIGQGITSLQSRISKFYEIASKWSTLSQQERTEFMQENDAMFRGESGVELARAFETGNYNLIQEALGNNEGLKEAIKLQLQELETALQIAEARRAAGEENEFEIKYLKEQIALLEDYQNAESEIYRADLKLRLDQEKAQLDIYKDYLQKQKEALEESLDKRRDAYQKYFDAVNEQAEDEDYDKQATMLTTNLSKLASSTNGTAMQQTKELEKQFEQLEEERLKTLRERAQEAVLSNLDNEVSEINEKFDKLLEDEAQLLAAMKGEIAADPNNFIQTMLTSGIQGMTATGAEDYIKNNFATAFDSILPAGATEGIKVDTREDGTLILNINGTEIPIGESAQQDLYITVMNALKQLGLK